MVSVRGGYSRIGRNSVHGAMYLSLNLSCKANELNGKEAAKTQKKGRFSRLEPGSKIMLSKIAFAGLLYLSILSVPYGRLL